MSILGMSNLEYHADRLHLSSSSLKTLIQSPEQFFQEYILNQRPQSSADHFTEGSFMHTLILEPELISQYAIFPGLRKAGAAWEQFKKDNEGKQILSMPQKMKCEKLYESYAAMSVATSLISGGIPEHNMTSTILGVPVKARADYIVPARRCIIDVKTTSMPSGKDSFAQTIQQYKYDLSAALYCQIAHDTYGHLFDFYWLVLSKDDKQCHVYKASTDTLSAGAALVTKALVLYKKCLNSGIWVANQKEISYDTNQYEVEVI